MHCLCYSSLLHHPPSSPRVLPSVLNRLLDSLPDHLRSVVPSELFSHVITSSQKDLTSFTQPTPTTNDAMIPSFYTSTLQDHSSLSSSRTMSNREILPHIHFVPRLRNGGTSDLPQYLPFSQRHTKVKRPGFKKRVTSNSRISCALEIYRQAEREPEEDPRIPQQGLQPY